MLIRRMVVVMALGGLLVTGDWCLVAAGQRQESGALETVAAPDSAVGLFAPGRLAYSLQEAAQKPPAPTHTGISALVRSTASDFAAFPRRKSTWVILAIGGASALAVHPADDEVNDRLQDSTGLRRAMKPGKYLGYVWVQGGTAIGLYLIGRYAMEPEAGTHTNKVSHLGFDLLRANIVTSALTYGVKYAVRRDRPTGECCAFPSGHASVTFATASVLERHFGYRGSWPMFAIGGYVAASRLTENRHFLSDVVFGSALGIASGWTVVGRHGRDKFTMVPVPVHGGVALAGAWPIETRGAPHIPQPCQDCGT